MIKEQILSYHVALQQFIPTEQIIVCGHCTLPFEDWIDIKWVTTCCGCTTKVCVSCEEKFNKRKKEYETKTIHSHS